MPAVPFQMHEVPGVQLMQQGMNMARGYALAMMLLDWKERYRPGAALFCQGHRHAYPGALQGEPRDPKCADHPASKTARAGLRAADVAVGCGAAELDGLLRPAVDEWRAAIVVIAGIRQTPSGAFEVKVYDPWPGNGIGCRALAGWYTWFSHGTHGVSSRDSSAGVEAVFLLAVAPLSFRAPE
jgi:hypothetical protein